MLFKDLDNIKQQRLRNDIVLIKKLIDADLDAKIKASIQKYNQIVPYKPLQIIQKPTTVNE